MSTGPVTKEPFHRWGTQAFLPSCPSVVTGLPCCIGLPVRVGFLCLESPPCRGDPSGLSASLPHPGKAFLASLGRLPSCLTHFLAALIKVMAAFITSTSFHRRHPQRGFWTRERDRASTLSSGAQLILYVTVLGRTRSNIKTKQITHTTLKTWVWAPV